MSAYPQSITPTYSYQGPTVIETPTKSTELSHADNTTKMAYFISLPHEILHSVLTCVDPRDLASLSLCCEALHRFIQNDRLLFKELYLQRLVSLMNSVFESGHERC
jgi:hypothetical protein